MSDMDAASVRTAKIRDLVAQAGGPQAFADRYGVVPDDGREWSRAQVNQWVMDKPKPIGAKIAREVERRIGLPVGWMDQVAAPAVALPAPPRPAPVAMDESTAGLLIRRLEGDIDQLRVVLSSLLFTLAVKDGELLEAVEKELRSKPPSYQDRGMHSIFLLLLSEARKAAGAARDAARPRAKAGSR